MKKIATLVGAMVLAVSPPAAAEQRVVCTFAVDIGSNETLIQDGKCDERISSASTFKIAISLMGFDSGIFTAPDQPEWPFQEGYIDWNPIWRQATTPESWMRDSAIWYSQRATEQMGLDQFTAYVQAFEYGNKDVSGDSGEANGLTHAWLSSSLQISPKEQVSFITRMILGELSVSSLAVKQTKGLLAFGERPDGWDIYGKTGAGLPFDHDGNKLRGQPFGWYVGWAERERERRPHDRICPAAPLQRTASTEPGCFSPRRHVRCPFCTKWTSELMIP